MFKHKVSAKAKAQDQAAAQDQPVQDFLQVWRAMKEEWTDKTRLRKLEIRADKMWQDLSQAHKDVAWMTICPEHRFARETFGAHAVILGAK